nr:ATP-binding protein [Tenuifilaceae bacterium]
VKELEKVKSAFLSNISHEIRTPLNGILGFTQYLLSPSVSEEDKEHYGRLVQKLGNRLLRIVEDILELSKVETNQLEIHYTDFNINELLGELYQSYSNNEDFLAKNLNFRFIKSLPDSQAVFSIDVYRVKKIMAHLIENAIKFTNVGSVEFGYYADSPSSLKFFVKDTGIGIPKKAQTRVFERFYKHIAEDQFTLYEGTGVGLAIAKGFALAMGGRIEVESVPNHGSTFYLYIPKKSPEQNNLPTNTEPVQSWENKTILIVEDDLISYQYIEALLSRTNVRLIHVKNAEDAIEVCNINNNLNLILLDIQLPFMNGVEAARVIRQNNKAVPIITQTANTIHDEGKSCIDAGCNAIIAKPIDPDEFFNLINKLII